MAVKQTIPNTSQNTKSYTFGKFKGIDTSSSVFEVSPNRAVEMKNIINEDGVNHKRPGWESAPLENIVYYRKYLVDSTTTFEIYVKKENGLNYIGVRAENSDLYFTEDIPFDDIKEIEFIGENKNGDFAYYDFIVNFEKAFTRSKIIRCNELGFFVYDLEDMAYTPRTTISITPDTNLTATRASFEKPNLLTDKVINSATNSEVKYIPITIEFIGPNSCAIRSIQLHGAYYSYNKADNRKNVTIYVKEGQEMYISDGTTIYDSYTAGGVAAGYLYIEGGNEDGTDKLISGTSIIFNNVEKYIIKKYNGESVNFNEPTESIIKRKYILEDKIEYKESVDSTSPNVTIISNEYTEVKVKVQTYENFGSRYSYSKDKELREYEFTNIKNGIAETKLYWTNNGSSAGEIDFGSGAITLFGDFPPPIEGQDNIFIEFTKYKSKVFQASTENFNIYELSLISNGVYFYNNGKYFSEKNKPLYIPSTNYIDITSNGIMDLGDNSYCIYDEDGLSFLNGTDITIDGRETKTYSLIKSQSNEMSKDENPQSLANDKLFLSRNGLLALKYTSTIKSNDRITLERSGFINKLLVNKIRAAFDKPEEHTVSSVVYQNRYYLFIDDTLFVADARYKSSPRQQDMDDVFNYEWWIWKDVPLKRFVKPILDDDLMFISTDNKLCRFKYNLSSYSDDNNIKINDGELTYIASSDNLFQINMEIAPNIKDGTQIKKVKNKFFDSDNYCAIDYIIFDSFKETYYVSDFDKYTGRFKLKDKTGEYVNASATFFDGYEVYYCNPRNIVSEWYTPVVDMGTSLYSKNLLTSTLVFEPNIEGEIKFGYLTRRKPVGSDKDSNLLPAKELDFNDLDFTDFSFSPGFAGSRTLRTKARNFNFIQFRIISDSPRDCALNNFTITYNIGRKNKGVR